MLTTIHLNIWLGIHLPVYQQRDWGPGMVKCVGPTRCLMRPCLRMSATSLVLNADGAYALISYRERKCAKNYNKWHNKFIFLSCNQHFGNSKPWQFRVLFDKIASVYFFWEICLHFSIGNGQPREPAMCQLYRHAFVPYTTRWKIWQRKNVGHQSALGKVIGKRVQWHRFSHAVATGSLFCFTH